MPGRHFRLRGSRRLRDRLGGPIDPIGERPASAACDAALNAVGAARAGMAHLDQARGRQGLPPLPFGMALHLGEMLWGNIGTADRLDFTAIGPAVNLVSRLEGLCASRGMRLGPCCGRFGTDCAAHLGSQLPIPVRGVYYDQWQPGPG